MLRFLVFSFCFSFCSLGFARDSEHIMRILQSNFDACNREDVNALMDTCSEDMPDRKGFKEASFKLFKEKDVHYSLVDFRLVEVDGDYATAQVVQKTHSTDRDHESDQEKSYRNGTTLLPEAEVVRYIAAFKKDAGVWKCYMTISEPVPVK